MDVTRDYEQLLQSVQSIKSENINENTATKRELWCQLQTLKSQVNNGATGVTVEQLGNIEEKLKIQPKKQPLTVLGVIRLIAVLLGIFFLTPLLIILSPVRLFHSLARSLGIPNGYLPGDVLLRLYARSLLLLACVEVDVEGNENAEKVADKAPVLGLFQHSSNLDSFVITGFNFLSFKWIGKKSLFYVPLVGQMAFLYGILVGVDRSNREKAINALHHAEAIMKKFGRSIAISPEGTRSTIGQLLEFKKGPFHMAKNLQVPILPMIIFGAFELWPPKQVTITPGRVTLRFLPPVMVEDYNTLDHDQLSGKLRTQMLAGMAVPPARQKLGIVKRDASQGPVGNKVSTLFLVQHYVALFVLVLSWYYVLRWLF